MTIPSVHVYLLISSIRLLHFHLQFPSISDVKSPNPFNARAGHHSGRHVFGHSSPAAIARKVFKPSTDSTSFLVSIKKIVWFGCGVFSWWRHKEGMFFKFLPTLPGLRRQSNESFIWLKKFIWLKLFLKTTRSSASLEPMIDLLACLEPEL